VAALDEGAAGARGGNDIRWLTVPLALAPETR